MVVDSRTRRPPQYIKVSVSRVGFRPPEIRNSITGKSEPVFMPYTAFLPPSVEKSVVSIRNPTVITGPDGCFFIPCEVRWGIYIAPMCLFPVTGSLLLRKDETVEITRHLVSNASEVDIGKVVWHNKRKKMACETLHQAAANASS
jgi:hypothetical protein